MTAMPAAETMTAQEFLALPEAQHGRPWNLVDGEVVVTEATPHHQSLAGRLYVAFANWIDTDAGRGRVYMPIDVELDSRNVFAPDVLWYAEGHGPRDETRRPSPMPDLAVEIRSASTWRYDVGAKKSGYEREGLPELWLVDTAASEVLVFRRSKQGVPSFDVSLQLGTDDMLESPLLPGFALGVDRLFA